MFESAVSLFAHHPELVAEGFGLHFVEFCLSRGPVAGRRMSRIFCSGERRLFQQRDAEITLGAMWTVVRQVCFQEK